MIDSAGLILTTARNLGSAPVAEFVTAGGLIGQAWVIGRDDAVDMALLQVIDPGQEYPALEVSAVPKPLPPEQFVRISFTDAAVATVAKQQTTVGGTYTDFNTGIFYAQIQAPSQSGAEGGVIIDNETRLRGLRMTEAQMITLGKSVGEVWVMSADALALIVLPSLKAGILNILPSASAIDGSQPGAPPGIPAIYAGTVRVGGQIPQGSTRIYARVTKSGLTDLWFSQPLDFSGNFVIPVGITVQGYDNATVQFWIDATHATEIASYAGGVAVLIDLTFPSS